MAIKIKNKEEIFKEFKMHESDTGSAGVQVAILTHRIKYLTDHLKQHPKDFSSRRGLLKLVAKRRKLLNYLKDRDYNMYLTVVDKLNIRK